MQVHVCVSVCACACECMFGLEEIFQMQEDDGIGGVCLAEGTQGKLGVFMKERGKNSEMP